MNEVTLEDLFETTEDGIIIFDPIYDEHQQVIDFEYHKINQAGLRLLHRTHNELIGNRLLLAFPGVGKSDLFQRYKRVIDTGTSFRTEFLYQDDGLDTWFSNTGHRVNQQLLVHFSDISGYKRLLEEKAKNEGLYRALIRALPTTDVALIDRQYSIRIAKGTPFEAYGYQDHIPEQAKLTDILDQEASKPIIKFCQQCFKGKTIKEEISVDDTKYRLSFVPAYDYERLVFGCLVVAEDIGIFSLSEDELRNKLYALESAKESLEQFAYVASHDLQEPLRKIRAFGDRINTRFADQLNETGRDYFNRMQHAAQRMQVLIDDLLKYSRVGRVQNDFESIDLNVLIQEVLSDMETTIEEAQAVVDVKDLPTIEGEPIQLRQLFQNLISNAIKFKKDNSLPHITVSAQPVKSEESDIPMSGEDMSYEIMVKDNGIGFDEKYLDRIFNIFQRLHGRNQYPGTGIGLAICRKIIENHQGDIFATSKLDEGATFHVILPQQQSLMV
ncbi:MAG: ATP-binding protein [Cyclobacteriaceae bacterium]